MSVLGYSLLFTFGLAIFVLSLTPQRFAVRWQLEWLVASRRRPLSRFAGALDAAGLYSKTPSFTAAGLAIVALLASGVAALLFGIIGAIAAPLAVLYGFRLWLQHRQRTFLSRVLAELPGFLNTMQATVRGGGTTRNGYQRAIEQSRYIRRYLAPTVVALQTGQPFREVLVESRKIFPIKIWHVFTRQIVLFEELGGDIADTLADTVEQINAIIEMQQSARSETASQRQQMRAIFAIGFGGIFLYGKLLGISPLVLVEKPLGWVFLIVGVSLIAIAVRINASQMRAIDRRISR